MAFAWEQFHSEFASYYCRLSNISRYHITRYRAQHTKFDGKTSVRLRSHDRHPYLALTGKPWVPLVSYSEKIDRDISGAQCILHNQFEHYTCKITDTSHTDQWCHVHQGDTEWLTVREISTWWRHQMETFSALLAICAGNSPITGEFPAQRPVTRSLDVFFDLSLNKPVE